MQATPTPSPKLFAILGPGILFAGAAIGVSHLVQSTRAGAIYGLALLPAMLIVHLLKYPGLSAGARFSGATGRTIVSGYKQLGKLSHATTATVFFATAIPLQAAIASVTAVVAIAAADVLLPSAFSSTGGAGSLAPRWLWAFVLQLVAAVIAVAGGFRWLDRIMKVLMSALAVLTIAAAFAVVPRLDLSTIDPLPPELLTVGGLTFVLAFLGWMPAPLDVAMWNSLWCVSKQKSLGAKPHARVIKLEFLLGYAKCITLAAAFIVLGAALIFGGDAPVASGAGIVAQLLAGYADALSPRVAPLVAVCAVGVMFSTLLSCTDALPRIALDFMHREPRRPFGDRTLAPESAIVSRPPPVAVLPVAGLAFVLVATASGVLMWSEGRPGAFLALVDFATVVSFLSTPALALVHHRLLNSTQMPSDHRARAWEQWLSRTAIAVFTLFAVVFAANFITQRFV